MPPFLIAMMVAGLYFLIPKNQRSGVAVLQTPNNTPIGVNTGFVVPPGQVGGSPSPTTGVTNAPGTRQSGVPQSSPQTQAFVPPASQPASEFYNYPNVLQPRFTPTQVPNKTSSGCSGSCGGCSSGGCGGKKKGSPTDCSISAARASNSGCLTPSTRSLFTPTNQPLFDSWFANVASDNDANAFTAYRANQQAVQDANPQGDDVTPSVGFTSTVIGIPTYKRTRSRVQ